MMKTQQEEYQTLIKFVIKKMAEKNFLYLLVLVTASGL